MRYPFFRFLFALFLGAACAGSAWSKDQNDAKKPPSFAFYYGSDVPWEALGAFDYAVVEPGHVKPLGTPEQPRTGWWHRLNPGTQVVAYIAVGEVHPTRDYYKRMQSAWKLGENKDWDSIVVDQAAPGWIEFYLKEVIEPLWAQGYRAFFLDTLDSFYLVAKTPEAQKRQIAGMAALVKAIKAAKPEAKLIFNRGFEILPEVHQLAFAVAAESLVQGFDAGKQLYREVPTQDREWLLNQLKKCQTQYGLHAISIDYVPPEKRELARETAEKIKALGIIPWVANPALNLLGIGAVEVMPRQVLAVHDEAGNYSDLAIHQVHRMATPHLNYLGLDSRYVFKEGAELEQIVAKPLAGRYAGVLFWFADGKFPENPLILKLMSDARNQGVPIVFGGEMPSPDVLKTFGLEASPDEKLSTQLRVEKRSPHVGFEIEPKPVVNSFTPLLLDKGDVWMRVNSPTGRYADVVAITDWGGYAISRYWQVILNAELGFRWAVDPVEFLRAALRVPRSQPMPDVTTETGRRLLLVHHDGDGFASRAEIPGTPLASEAMLSEFLEKYRVPTTVSVIEAEVSGQGLYAHLSQQMESAARKMFALPHVEIASHSYSHPFFWALQETLKTVPGKKYSLPVPAYSFNIQREILGSTQYINTKLAPQGKATKVFLWTGDTRPLAAPLKTAYEAGLLNMNGGDTTITKGDQSLSRIGAMGMMKGEYFQVYAPNQNENVYTNDWTGPFYGFERVIETFELTDKPRRFKPVNIYYHTYIASKRASILSLHKAYQWAMAQELHPVYGSEYIERVLDWRRATVARDGRGHFEMRSGQHLRQWRIAQTDAVSLCHGIAGSTVHEGTRYLNAMKSVAVCAYSTEQKQLNIVQKEPIQLESANAKLLDWQNNRSHVQVTLFSHVPLKSRWLNTGACTLDSAASSAGLRVTPQVTPRGNIFDIESASLGQAKLVFRCPE